MNALPTHGGELPQPESMPERVVSRIGNPSVEPSFHELPAESLADDTAECPGIIVGVAVAEGDPNSVEQVLSIDEPDGALGSRLRGQRRPPKK